MTSLHPLRMRLLYFTTSSMFLTVIVLPILYVFDPPLDFEDFLRILQQIFPVFVGFLVSAVGYATSHKRAGSIQVERYNILSLILNSAFSLYWVGAVALTAIFLWSHSGHAPPGKGMSKDIFFTVMTILVSVITGVAGLISTKIFFEDAGDRQAPAANRTRP